MNNNSKHSRRLMKDEREQYLETKGKKHAAETMILMSQICWIVCLFKNLSAAWGFFSILMSGGAVYLFYKYDKDEQKIYLFGSIIFGLIAIFCLAHFIFF